MGKESWLVVDFSFDAPNDAGEGHRCATSVEGIQAVVTTFDPEELLCDLGVWIVRRRRVVDLIDLRPFVAIADGVDEVRWSDEARFVERFEAASGLVPRVVWREVASILPVLETPLLADGADDWVINPRDVARIARERGLRHTWRPAATR